MALATNSTPGSIVLGGDLTGTAASPQLRNTGVIPGEYSVSDIVVDAKGRIVAAAEATTIPAPSVATGSVKGVVQIAGDLTGTADLPTLVTTAVTPGTYNIANITVDSKGRVTAAAVGTAGAPPDATVGGVGIIQLAGVLTGTASYPTLTPTGVTPGSYTTVNVTVDGQGRIATITNGTPPDPIPDASITEKGSIQLSGDLAGTGANPQLSETGISAGTYLSATINVDVSGRITSIVNGSYLPATTSTKGAVQIGDNINVAEGVISVSAGSDTVRGMVKSGNTSNITISAGEINIGSNVLTLNTSNTVTKATNLSIVAGTTSFTPDLAAYNVFNLAAVDQLLDISVAQPIKGLIGDWFQFICDNERYTLPTATASTSTGSTVSLTPGSWTNPAFGPSQTFEQYHTLSLRAGTAQVAHRWIGASVWTEYTWLPISGYWTKLKANNTTFVGIGRDLSNAVYSVDGFSWQSVTLPSNEAWVDLVWNGTQWYAISESGATASSPDGITWTPRSLPSPGAGSWSAIAWNGIIYLTVGYPSLAATSTDGITWISRTLPSTPETGFSLTTNVGTTFVVVSSEVSATTTDGVTWNTGTIDALSSGDPGAIETDGTVVYLTRRFYSSPIYVSYDGINWRGVALTSGDSVTGWTGLGWSSIENRLTGTSRTGKILRIIPKQTRELTFSSAYKFSNMKPTFGKFTVECVYNGTNFFCTYNN